MSAVIDKVQDTVSLVNRIETNKQYGDSFDDWTRGLLGELKFNSVLDICCGTGKQLAIYSDMGIADINGVDISKDSLNIAECKAPRAELKCQAMETIFVSDNRKYDLVSCFYGLYYCADVDKLVGEILSHLNPGGTVLVVGPYGDNNKALFELLGEHYSLPPDVIYSCTEFMNDLMKMLQPYCDIEQRTFLNRVNYPDAEALYKYWKATTFYSEEHDRAVMDHFKSVLRGRNSFTVEKHVKAIIGGIKSEYFGSSGPS